MSELKNLISLKLILFLHISIIALDESTAHISIFLFFILFRIDIEHAHSDDPKS